MKFPLFYVPMLDFVQFGRKKIEDFYVLSSKLLHREKIIWSYFQVNGKVMLISFSHYGALHSIERELEQKMEIDISWDYEWTLGMDVIDTRQNSRNP